MLKSVASDTQHRFDLLYTQTLEKKKKKEKGVKMCKKSEFRSCVKGQGSCP